MRAAIITALIPQRALPYNVCSWSVAAYQDVPERGRGHVSRARTKQNACTGQIWSLHHPATPCTLGACSQCLQPLEALAVGDVINTEAAPGALGPYSQAIATTGGKTLYISGQLGLDPKTMDFVGDSVSDQATQVRCRTDHGSFACIRMQRRWLHQGALSP